MSTKTLWVMAVVMVCAGTAGLYVADQLTGATTLVVRFASYFLFSSPALILNFTLRRRRRARREDSPDSVEFQAQRVAASAAFQDALLLGALLLLAVLVAPGPLPALWVMAFLFAAMGAYWVRYFLALEELRG